MTSTLRWARRRGESAAFLSLGLLACGGAASPLVGAEDVQDAGTANHPQSGADAAFEAADGTDARPSEESEGGPDALADDGRPDGSADAGDVDAERDVGTVDGDAGEGVPVPCAAQTTCQNATNLGTLVADDYSNSASYLTVADSDDQWLVVSTTPTTVNGTQSVMFVLSSPSHVDFDLDVYLSNDLDPTACTQLYGSSAQGPGNRDVVHPNWPNGLAAKRTLKIHVTPKPGSQCSTGSLWTLELHGGS